MLGAKKLKERLLKLVVQEEIYKRFCLAELFITSGYKYVGWN